MEEKTSTINLLWLSRKGLLRFKSWSFLKMLVVVIWGFALFNFYSAYLLQPRLVSPGLPERMLAALFLILNLVMLLFFVTLAVLTLKIRQTEFGLYRCGGAARGELLSLILNEGLLLAFFSFIALFALQALFLYLFRLEIAGLFRIVFDFKFALFCLKNFILTQALLFIVLLLCYLPLGLYYCLRDPYDIVRY